MSVRCRIADNPPGSAPFECSRGTLGTRRSRRRLAHRSARTPPRRPGFSEGALLLDLASARSVDVERHKDEIDKRLRMVRRLVLAKDAVTIAVMLPQPPDEHLE